MQDLPVAVLDTNVVLAWLAFRDPRCSPLIEAIESGRLRWIATVSMRDELAHVIGRGVVSAWLPDEAMLWNTWNRFARMVEARQLTGEASRLRCTDPDDQKFIELALDQAGWLISRDRAVLKLARRASRFGLQVLAPERWTLP